MANYYWWSMGWSKKNGIEDLDFIKQTNLVLLGFFSN